MRITTSFRIAGILPLIGRVAREILCFRQFLPDRMRELTFSCPAGPLRFRQTPNIGYAWVGGEKGAILAGEAVGCENHKRSACGAAWFEPCHVSNDDLPLRSGLGYSGSTSMNKPSEVVTADHFSRVLEASRLLSTPQWREFCAVAHADGKNAARFLVQERLAHDMASRSATRWVSTGWSWETTGC